MGPLKKCTGFLASIMPLAQSITLFSDKYCIFSSIWDEPCSFSVKFQLAVRLKHVGIAIYRYTKSTRHTSRSIRQRWCDWCARNTTQYSFSIKTPKQLRQMDGQTTIRHRKVCSWKWQCQCIKEIQRGVRHTDRKHCPHFQEKVLPRSHCSCQGATPAVAKVNEVLASDW